MTTLLCYASTALGLATVATALADEALPAAYRRVLVLSNNAAVPEVAYGVGDAAGIGALVRLSTTCTPTTKPIAPQHPAAASPR